MLTSLDYDEFVERLETNLNSIEGYVGVNNHMGSRLTSDRGRMDLVMKTLRERDVLFLDSKTSSRSVANEMADRNGVPSTTRDVFLDHEINLGKFDARWLWSNVSLVGQEALSPSDILIRQRSKRFVAGCRHLPSAVLQLPRSVPSSRDAPVMRMF